MSSTLISSSPKPTLSTHSACVRKEGVRWAFWLTRVGVSSEIMDGESDPPHGIRTVRGMKIYYLNNKTLVTVDGPFVKTGAIR